MLCIPCCFDSIKIDPGFNEPLLDELSWPLDLVPDNLVGGVFKPISLRFQILLLLLGLLLVGEELAIVLDGPVLVLLDWHVLVLLPLVHISHVLLQLCLLLLAELVVPLLTPLLDDQSLHIVVLTLGAMVRLREVALHAPCVVPVAHRVWVRWQGLQLRRHVCVLVQFKAELLEVRVVILEAIQFLQGHQRGACDLLLLVEE